MNQYSVLANATSPSNTAKTVINLLASAGSQATLIEFGISFDGVTATAVPILVELCLSTQATTGTSTAFTPVQLSQFPVGAGGVTAAINYTAEPTVLTPVKQWYVPPTSGFVMQFPLGREPATQLSGSATAKSMAFRITTVTASGTPAYRSYAEYVE